MYINKSISLKTKIKYTHRELIHYVSLLADYFEIKEEIMLDYLIQTGLENISPVFQRITPHYETIMINPMGSELDMLCVFSKTDKDKIEMGYLPKTIEENTTTLENLTYRDFPKNGKMI